MEFSILIPTYNSAQFIEECLDAIFKLNFPAQDYEVIIIDGGSSDSTLDIVNKFEDIRVVKSTNISIANSRNLGVAESIGDKLVFIDSDCLVNKNLLLKSKKHLEKYKCCGSFYRAHKNHSWIAKTWLIAEKKEKNIVDWITSGTLVVSRSFFLKIGGFNESLKTEEDEDFGFRVRKNGGQLFNDFSIASVHLGQADTIADFFKKEAWRGKSLIKPVKDIVSMKFSLFDAMILCYFLNLCVILFSVICYLEIFFTLSAIFLLLVPLLLTLRKLKQLHHFKLFVQLYILYIVYLFARCWSLIKYNQFKQFFGNTV